MIQKTKLSLALIVFSVLLLPLVSAINIDLVIPPNATIVHGGIPLQIVSSDEYGIKGMQVIITDDIGQVVFEEITLEDVFYKEFITTLEDDGAYTINVTACKTLDECLNELFTLTIDNALPVINFLPINGEIVNGMINIEISADDTNFAYMNIIILNDTDELYNVSNITESSITLSVNTTTTDDGAYDFDITACDLAGNCQNLKTTTYIDNTAPIINLISPADGSVVDGIIALDISTSDTNGVKNLTISISNEIEELLYGTTDETEIYAEFETTEADNGMYYIKIIACDILGNCNEVNSVTEVNNVQPTTPAPSVQTGSGGGSATYWKCEYSEWSECDDDGLQTRICNAVETNSKEGVRLWKLDKTPEIRACSIPTELPEQNEEVPTTEEVNEEPEQTNAGITGAVIGAATSTSGIIAIVFVLLVASAGAGIAYHRKK